MTLQIRLIENKNSNNINIYHSGNNSKVWPVSFKRKYMALALHSSNHVLFAFNIESHGGDSNDSKNTVSLQS